MTIQPAPSRDDPHLKSNAAGRQPASICTQVTHEKNPRMLLQGCLALMSPLLQSQLSTLPCKRDRTCKKEVRWGPLPVMSRCLGQQQIYPLKVRGWLSSEVFWANPALEQLRAATNDIDTLYQSSTNLP